MDDKNINLKRENINFECQTCRISVIIVTNRRVDGSIRKKPDKSSGKSTSLKDIDLSRGLILVFG